MNFVRQSAEVYQSEGPVVAIGAGDVATLQSAVASSPRGRVRINVHPGVADALHEMFIAIKADSYIHPHKHLGKSESFHLVHGAVDVVIFDDEGEIRQIVALAASGGKPFYYRLSAPLFHTLLVRSDLLIMHETTNGPFRANETVLASFAPAEGDAAATAAYRADLKRRVASFVEKAS